MNFTKMQGVGNDFVVVNELEVGRLDPPALARLLCDRKFGIGADGLLIIGKAPAPASFSFRMFNPDGSEDMCGNGLRCASLWANNHGLVGGQDIIVSTKDGFRDCRILFAEADTATVRVNMGPALFNASDLPAGGPPNATFLCFPLAILEHSYDITAVNTGSTHTVIFRETPILDGEFFSVSPIIENHPMFPERTSVLWVTKEADNSFYVRIWERGAGETLGCGTGACAVGVAAVVNCLAERVNPVLVESKGGTLVIEWLDDIIMTGPAVNVFQGSYLGSFESSR